MENFKQDAHETPMIFRIERRKDGEVTAVFVTEPFDQYGTQMTCYSHIGQHGGCDFGWFNSTRHRLATPEEYADLKAELEAKPYGYRVKVYKRLNKYLREQFNNEVRKIQNVKR